MKIAARKSSSSRAPKRETRPPYPAGSLLSIEHLSSAEIGEILARAAQMQKARPAALARRCFGKRVGLLFYENSTRTRVSFEFASKALGAIVTIVNAGSSSIEKGESLVDTGITLMSAGCDAIVLRHANSGAPYLLAREVAVPVLNAGDGMHEHPSQALLDAYTILQHRKTLRGLRVVIVGDILHSRVARSNVHLLSKMGASVVLCGPEELAPEIAVSLATGTVVERDFDRALAGADVVMMLRIQKERLAGFSVDLDRYIRSYQLNQERLQKLAPKALVMHPGPMIRGLEITSEVADGPHSLIPVQVKNGVAIRMALIERALHPALHSKKGSR